MVKSGMESTHSDSDNTYIVAEEDTVCVIAADLYASTPASSDIDASIHAKQIPNTDPNIKDAGLLPVGVAVHWETGRRNLEGVDSQELVRTNYRCGLTLFLSARVSRAARASALFFGSSISGCFALS